MNVLVFVLVRLLLVLYWVISFSMCGVKICWCVRMVVVFLCRVVLVISLSCSNDVNMWNGLVSNVVLFIGWNVVECIGMLVIDRL